jgi:lipopolysaccharide transport system permease protein
MAEAIRVLSEASSSLVANVNLISKVYFPRLVIPTSTAVVALVDFLIDSAMQTLLIAWFGFLLKWQIMFLLAFIIHASLARMGRPHSFVSST